MTAPPRPKGLRVTAVEAVGTAPALGIVAGDEILAINGHPVPDLLAYRFLIAEEEVTLVTRRGDGSRHEFAIEKESDDDLGLEPEPLGVRVCGNKCLFCFVDQMPVGLRGSLYVKDDDFRHSFLHGSYITLTTLRPRDLQRIVDEKLSPLYISVHATDDEIRRRLLGKPRLPPILERLRHLTSHGIVLHTQAVLCPGINDGPVLQQTIDDLWALGPAVSSLAVVPIGLTRHREALPALAGYTPAGAAAVLDLVTLRQRRCRAERGHGFVYAADEFYLQAERPVPSSRSYDGYPQLDNGVGLVRDFLSELKRESRRLPARLQPPRSVLLVTGVSFAPILREACARLVTVAGLRLEVAAIGNRLFGPSVTVAGLLSGGDILAGLGGRGADLVVIPSIAVRDGDGVFLDDRSPADIEAALGLPVRMAEPTARGLVDSIRGLAAA